MEQLTEFLDPYLEAWRKTQLIMWQEKIQRLKIVRTGALHQSFTSEIESIGDGRTIKLKFAQYGIYQALGTGRGYSHDNGGDLQFLDKSYRHEHRLDVPRKVGPAWGGYMTSGHPRSRRDWMSKKLYMSIMNMKEDIARITGEHASAVICDALMDVRTAIS